MNRKTLSTLIMAATMAIGGLGAANINSNKTSHRNEVLLSSASSGATASSNSEASASSSSAEATASSSSEASASNSNAKATASSNSEANASNSNAKATASSNSEANTSNSSAKATASSSSQVNASNSNAKGTASSNSEANASNSNAKSTASSNSEANAANSNAKGTASSSSEANTSNSSAKATASSSSQANASNSNAKGTASSNSEANASNSNAKGTASSSSQANTSNSSAKATASSSSQVNASNSNAKATASSSSQVNASNSNAKATASSNSEANASNSNAKATASSNSQASTSSSSAKATTSNKGGQTEHKGTQGTSNKGGQTEHKGTQGTSNKGGQTEHKGTQGTSNKGGQTEHKGTQGTSNKGGQTEHKGTQGTSNKGGQIEHKGTQGTSNKGGQTEHKGTQGTSNKGGQTEHKEVAPQQPLTTYDGLVSTNNKTINVMSAPTTIPSYSFVVGTLSNGKNIKIISKDNGYYEIEFGGSIGYVNANDVNTTATTIPTSTSVANKENSIKKNENYPTTMKKYVAQQLKSYNEAHGNSLTKAQLEKTTNQISEAVNPKAAATVFEFLKVNEYRNVNAQELNQALQGKGILEGQGQGFINAAKEYNLDPVYLLAQCALETGWGQSNFAKGTTITEVADMNAPIKNSKGQLIGYKMIKLQKPVTVYNLFGVGAYDNTKEFSNKATITAEAYAYNHGWTSVPSALQGAAQFISNNYVHNSKYNQNTPYALRYINGEGSSINHQYSTDINYGQTIGEIMKQYSYLYNANDKFSFGIPTFQSK